MGYAIKHGSNNNGLCVETPNLNRVGRAGHGRHGGEASALCVGSDDVGLELLALLILLCLSIVRASSTLRSACAKLVLFFQEKRTNINMSQP